MFSKITALLLTTAPMLQAEPQKLTFAYNEQGLQLQGLSIRYDNGYLAVLNQQKLPLEEEWISVETPEQMVEIITSLKVRGAPLIGIAAILSLAQLAEQKASYETIEQAAYLLRSARPTAVNLANYIDRVLTVMKNSTNLHQDILNAVEGIFLEDTALCEAMGIAGAAIIQPEEKILTYCNTGSLATAGIGTALGVIKTAHAQGKRIHVYACETRPLLQGGRLTAWELEQNGIPYTLICDNMAASLMKSGEIDRVLVGADRIAANGDFANKIGTYSLAVLAHHHQIPFHVVAPYTTIDPKCPDGDSIKIEQRSSNEVRGASGSFGSVVWSPKNAPVYNPAFDVTPASLVTSYILDQGNVSAETISSLGN
jgi:methylthioribose-1-phosphate isomerase